MANYIKGIDVSHYEPHIDWEKVKRQEIRFVYMKATQGTNYFDTFFPGYWAETKKFGLLRGAYHLIDPRLDGEAQAKFFLSKVGETLGSGDLPHVLDLEDFDDIDPSTGGQKGARSPSKGGGKAPPKAKVTSTRDASPAQVIRCVEAWLKYVEDKTKRTPILYSTGDYFKSRLSNPTAKPPSWANRYPVWVAHYRSIEGDAQPAEQPGWPGWTFWQYHKNGLVEGITDDIGRLTGVDLNFFKGGLTELYALAGSIPPAGTVVDQPQAEVPKAVEDDKVAVPVNVPAETMAVSSPATYCIEPGDTLFALAMRFHTTVEAILAANPQLTNPNFIRVGDNLNIPQAG